ncbi:uncharacterized protein AMSG_04460 [Thecamonas trahens ATCC 50062]|uniref:Uncharacterized protein n=1 Tax=Thecamonas trahens ATCC 50062 TaxID=461836 RepID=A0A0L0D7P9_THETB|nr:hypothetical protein AMSG_04460 [Thecamonas trahens ATCC 50062]KNC48230.1 hypothetical protein AMSG_04460 [Thecamonas trahens ATCC 50062]|eukprot:XP_013758799.1 hypothetical protein AMSG_04460 [Thecamonas trahens ATCC 50062]
MADLLPPLCQYCGATRPSCGEDPCAPILWTLSALFTATWLVALAAAAAAATTPPAALPAGRMWRWAVGGSGALLALSACAAALASILPVADAAVLAPDAWFMVLLAVAVPLTRAAAALLLMPVWLALYAEATASGARAANAARSLVALLLAALALAALVLAAHAWAGDARDITALAPYSLAADALISVAGVMWLVHAVPRVISLPSFAGVVSKDMNLLRTTSRRIAVYTALACLAVVIEAVRYALDHLRSSTDRDHRAERNGVFVALAATTSLLRWLVLVATTATVVSFVRHAMARAARLE